MTPFTKLIGCVMNTRSLWQGALVCWYQGIRDHKLFGVLKEDYSIANATGMFNIFKMDWDDQALELALTRDSYQN